MEECINYASRGTISQERPQPIVRQDYIPHTIEIESKNRGYLVRIGCQTFCFSTKEELIPLLTAYINNPNEIEKQWYEGTLFKD